QPYLSERARAHSALGPSRAHSRTETNMMTFIRGFVAAVLLLTGSFSAAAAPSKTLEVIVFPGGFNWPIWVAADKGFFADNGVAINITPTPSSSFQLTGLIDGKFDIA